MYGRHGADASQLPANMGGIQYLSASYLLIQLWTHAILKHATLDIEYFKLKEFEKTAKQDLSCLSSLKHGTRPPGETLPLCTLRKGASLSQTQGTLPEEFKQTGLTVFPSLLHSPYIFWPKIFLHDHPLIIKPSIKIVRFNHFFRSSFY